jgi:heterodisulfide reductase subunit B
MKEFALFPGCLIPERVPSYEVSLRKTAEILGVKFVEPTEDAWTCCAPVGIVSLDHFTSLSIGARNLAVVEEMGLDTMVTPCNGCFEGLDRTASILSQEPETLAKVNEVLAEVDKEYKGTVNVRQLAEIYHDEELVGVNKIKENIVKPLDNLRVGIRPGCHLFRPIEVIGIDYSERYFFLDDLINATGAESVYYKHRLRCCGGLLRNVSDNLTEGMLRERLVELREAEVDCVVTVCPLCFLQFDLGQKLVERKFKETFNIPTLTYSELLGLGMGLSAEELGLQTHRIKASNLLKKVGLGVV